MIGYMLLCTIKLDVLGGNTESEPSRPALWHEVLKWTTGKLLQPLSDRNRINSPPCYRYATTLSNSCFCKRMHDSEFFLKNKRFERCFHTSTVMSHWESLLHTVSVEHNKNVVFSLGTITYITSFQPS